MFRPNLLATTSFDGSIATIFKRTVTDVVCDNTREMALSETGQTYKVKHSRNSQAQLAPAREALATVHTIADDFAKEIAQLCAIDVTDRQWEQFLDQHVPRQQVDGQLINGRSLTSAENKRAALERLYRSNDRVAPWTGTAHGVLQAVNTYEHHEGTIRGAARPERNMTCTITGDFTKVDRSSWDTLRAVLRLRRTRGAAHPAPRGADTS